MAGVFGGNPYGTLGPSPTRVKRVNAAIAKKKAAAAAAAAGGGAATGGSSFSGLYAQASKLAQQQLNAQLAAIAQAQATAKATADRQAQLEATKGLAYSQGLTQLGLGKAVQDLYTGAGNEQASLAQGFSGDIRAQADADAARQQQMLAGTGQEGAVRNEGENLGNVNYMLNGMIPATQLDQTGRNLGALATLQPGFATQFGQMAEAARQNQWFTSELPQYADERSKARAQLPAMIQAAAKAQSDLTNQQFDNYVNWINSQKGVAGAAAKAPTVRNMADGTTQQWNPVTQTWDVIATKPPKAPPAGGTVRQKGIQRRNAAVLATTKLMNTWLGQGKNRTKTTTAKGLNGPVKTTVANPVGWDEAHNYVLKQLKLQLGKKYGYDDQDLEAIALQILDANGYKEPPMATGAGNYPGEH